MLAFGNAPAASAVITVPYVTKSWHIQDVGILALSIGSLKGNIKAYQSDLFYVASGSLSTGSRGYVTSASKCT